MEVNVSLMSKIYSRRGKAHFDLGGGERGRMAATEMIRGAERIVVALVPVTIEVCLPPDYFRDPSVIVCLDLDSLGVERTLKWINEANEAALRDSDAIVPTI